MQNQRIFLVSVELPSSSDSSKEQTAVVSSDESFRLPSTSRANQSIIFTDRLLASLNRWKITDRGAMHLITATAISLGHNIANFALNRESLRVARCKYRENLAEKKQNDFHVNVTKIFNIS